MTTFRKTLMATTMLGGLAIFATDAAQAGPNGGPSLGSISGFSSMRMDFNRVGGPNRALSRADMRVVPLEVKKSDKGARKDDKKSAAKKGTDFARVSNPKSKSGGKGKEVVSAPALRIPAPLAELYRVTGGNLDDIAKLAELVGWLKTGLPAAGSPLFPKPGEGAFALPEELGGGGPKGGEQSDRNFLDGWAGYSSAPGGPDTSKTGRAGIWTVVPGSQRQGDGYRETSYYDPATGRTGTVRTYWGEGGNRREITVQGTDSQSDNDWRVDVEHDDGADGSHTRTVKRTEVVYGRLEDEMAVFTSTTITTSGEGPTSQPGDQEPYDYVAPEPKDSQPVEEGTGRPGRTGWCSPTGGCVTGSVVQDPRIIPASDYSTPEMRSQLPSWATDPCPDCTSRGGGSGYSGYDPHNEGDGDVGGGGGGGGGGDMLM